MDRFARLRDYEGLSLAYLLSQSQGGFVHRILRLADRGGFVRRILRLADRGGFVSGTADRGLSSITLCRQNNLVSTAILAIGFVFAKTLRHFWFLVLVLSGINVDSSQNDPRLRTGNSMKSHVIRESGSWVCFAKTLDRCWSLVFVFDFSRHVVDSRERLKSLRTDKAQQAILNMTYEMEGSKSKSERVGEKPEAFGRVRTGSIVEVGILDQ